jgi:predicted ATPase/class 3 adenylate cyclase
LFCDLVDSTEIASHLDPEDWRDVVREYQQACDNPIRRFDGYVAQYLGDGLLAYFGYPHAHGDDAERAVRTGLAIVDAMSGVNTRLRAGSAVELAVRIGIHTGPVVVGEIGEGGRSGPLAMGDTLNIAARLQGSTDPNTVVISAATKRLVQGIFVLQDLGPQRLKGVGELPAFRAVTPAGVRSRLDVAAAAGLTPLVGREQELDLLYERWDRAKDGLGQVVLLSGEPGIGKSRLVQALLQRLSDERHTYLDCRCSPYAQSSAFLPIIDVLEQGLRQGTQWGETSAAAEKLSKLELALSSSGLPPAQAVPLFAALLSVPLDDRYPPLNLSPELQKHRTIESVLMWLLRIAALQPVLLVAEDLQWMDASSLDLITRLVEQAVSAPILVLITARPDFQAPWAFRLHHTHITLNRLLRHQVAQMVTLVAGGRQLPAELVKQVVTTTDGVPLFVEELTKMVLESGLLEEGSHHRLDAPHARLAIPSTLHDSLMARLDRLGPAKEIAQLAATLGREFPYALLSAVSPLDDASLRGALERLVNAELLYQRGLGSTSSYTFKHALIQQTAYESLLKSKRQQLHRAAAQALAERFPEMIEPHPELLAHHYTQAGMSAEAFQSWQRAGRRALERWANIEAVTHFRSALGALLTLPDTLERAQQELALLTQLGPALIATTGTGALETKHVYLRARQLCERIGEGTQLVPVLIGLYQFYIGSGDLRMAQDVAEQCLRLAEQSGSAVLTVIAEALTGVALFFRGELVSAREHLERMLPLYDPKVFGFLGHEYGHDPGLIGLAYLASVLQELGYADQALARHEEGLRLARSTSIPVSLAQVLQLVSFFYRRRRDAREASRYADEMTELSASHSFPQYVSLAAFLRGWALAESGDVDAGIERMREGLAGYGKTETLLARADYLSSLALALGHAGRPEEGLRVTAEALLMAQQTGERLAEAELYRVRGELLIASSEPSANPAAPTAEASEAEQCLQRALEITRQHSARRLELRAATSLTRFWRSSGRSLEAQQLLRSCYEWFREGRDTKDLCEAAALLEELAMT